MNKLKRIILLLLVLAPGIGWAELTPGPNCPINMGPVAYENDHYNVTLLYPDWATASAARPDKNQSWMWSWYAVFEPNDKWHCTYTESGGVVAKVPGPGYDRYLECYCTDPVYCQNTDGPLDTDEDGITDELDPWPNDDRNFTWKVVGIQKDQNGEITWKLIECVDENGNVQMQTIGTFGENDDVIELVQDDEKSSDAYKALYGVLEYSGDGGPTTDTIDDLTGGSSGIEIGPVDTDQESPTITPGTASEAGDTDSEMLGKITDNTAGAINAWQELLDMGANQGNTMNKMLEIEQQRERDTMDRDQEAEQEYSNASNYSENNDYSSDYTQNEIEGAGLDDDGITGESWFTSFFSNNPISTAIDNSGVQTSDSASSMSTIVLGEELVFDMAPRQGVLNMIGTMLLGLAGLTGLVIIVRG